MTDDTYQLELGYIFKKYRKKKKITGIGLSRMIGKSDAYISHIENGRNKNPDDDVVKEVLDLLEVPEEIQRKVIERFEMAMYAPLTHKGMYAPLTHKPESPLIKTSFITDENLRANAELIAKELESLNDKSKKYLIQLLEKQLTGGNGYENIGN